MPLRRRSLTTSSLALSLLAPACGGTPSDPERLADTVETARDAAPDASEDADTEATGTDTEASGPETAAVDAAPPAPDSELPDTEAPDSEAPDAEPAIDASEPHEGGPGRVVWRRLNRTELANTWRDLLPVGALADTLAADLPADDTGYGFDTTASTLTLSPLHLEVLTRAAETLAEAVTTPPLTAPVSYRFEAEFLDSTAQWGGPREGAMILASGGELVVPLELPRAGTWRLEVRAFEEAAGPDHARFAVLVDGLPARTFEVAATRTAPAVYAAELTLPAGAVTLELSYLNDYYAPPADRNLGFDWVSLAGPAELDVYAATPWPAVVACTPEALAAEAVSTPGGDVTPAEETAPCARETLTRLAERAWRRPDLRSSLDALLALRDAALAEGDSALDALRLAITATLLAPQALFRSEFVPEGPSPAPLDPWAIAARLSYFLWSTMPDEALFSAAREGRLATPDGISAEVARMLADPKAEALIANFAGQWLQVRDIANLIPDPGAFPSFDEPLRAAMREELHRFLRGFLLGDRDLLTMLTTPETWLNERLAKHYGLSAPADGGSGAWAHVAFTPETVRPGLLGKAGLMAVLATPFRTSAVRRGKWVLGQLLCAEPPPPPPGVEGLIPATGAGGEALTMRERMELHKTAPVCSACHSAMDPIGFALERYDGLGAWRDSELGLPIDDSGTLPDGRSFVGPGELAQVLADDPRLPACIAEKLFTYALGRGVRPADDATLSALTATFAASGYRFGALAAAIATAPPFRFQEAETP